MAKETQTLNRFERRDSESESDYEQRIEADLKAGAKYINMYDFNYAFYYTNFDDKDIRNGLKMLNQLIGVTMWKRPVYDEKKKKVVYTKSALMTNNNKYIPDNVMITILGTPSSSKEKGINYKMKTMSKEAFLKKYVYKADATYAKDGEPLLFEDELYN